MHISEEPHIQTERDAFMRRDLSSVDYVYVQARPWRAPSLARERSSKLLPRLPRKVALPQDLDAHMVRTRVEVLADA